MTSPSLKRPRTDRSRAIIALDLDCFYAQVAIRARPHLAHRPVVIVQKHLCVTSNYVARRLAHGAVQKMTPVSTALKACPDIVCIDGSDLTPFREANAEVLAVIRQWLRDKIANLPGHKFEVPCQKLGFDEVFIDVSRLVEREIAAGGRPWAFPGHVFGKTEDDTTRRTIMVASQLAAELRKRITDKTKLTLCAGISDSKLLAKLAVNMNKPNDQTAFLPDNAAQHVATRPPRHLPGFGFAAQEKLTIWAKQNSEGEMKNAGDVLRWFGDGKRGLAILARVVGNEDQARKILDLCRAVDNSPVVESGDAPKSITSMDSFRTCTSLPDVHRRVTVRAKDLVTRLLHDWELHARRPKTLNVGFRFRGDGFNASSRAIPMPTGIVSLCSSKGPQSVDLSVAALVKAALATLKDHASVSSSSKFDMTLISLGATNFTDVSGQNHDSQKIASFFESRQKERPVPSRVTGDDAAASTTPVTKPSANAEAAQCPICSHQLPSNIVQASVHVDSCLRRSEVKTNPRKKPRTISNTLRVDSFFRRI